MMRVYDRAEWRRRRKRMPFHAALDDYAADYLFDGEQWWHSSHPDYRKWRGAVYSATATATEFIKERWPWCPHHVVDDQCGIPGHRFCIYCSRPMPDAALGDVQ